MPSLVGSEMCIRDRAFITSSEFSEGIDKLIQIASRSMVALVCAERLP